jgi:phosphinothricin acetyltransferase
MATPVGEVAIREGRRPDLSAILDVYNHYVRTSPATFELAPPRVEDRIGWFEQHSGGGRYRILVAENRDGQILGWATTSPFHPREAYATTVEASVYLRPNSVRQGIGSRLYQELFRVIALEDIERIAAIITQPNPASVALHARYGFRLVGTFTRVGRKFDRFWDVSWYERPLRWAANSESLRPPGAPDERGSLTTNPSMAHRLPGD